MTDSEKQYYDNYPRDYVSEVKLTTENWVELLKNDEIFLQKNTDLIKKIFLSENHASTCKHLSDLYGVSPSSFNKPTVALARRIQEKMNLDVIIGDDGKEIFWRVLFWGRYIKNGSIRLFEWLLRPELLEAVRIIYPDWELIQINEKLDDEVEKEVIKNPIPLKDLPKPEYSPKNKTEPGYEKGHKTYPRSKVIQQQALERANYKCEINPEHTTFISKYSEKPFMEAHHLIPGAYTDSGLFEYSLDHIANVVCLCPNCHKEIHFGIDTDKKISELYELRKDMLKEAGIFVELRSLLEMYK